MATEAPSLLAVTNLSKDLESGAANHSESDLST